MTNEESKNKVKDTFYNASIKHWRSRAGLVFVNKKLTFSFEIPLIFLQQASDFSPKRRLFLASES